MPTDSSNVTLGPTGSSERALVDAAWRQIEKLSGRIKPGRTVSTSVEISGYRMLGEVHRGGQGVVYQAIQESTRRKVAIKVLKHGPFADATEFARFDREVDVLSRLNHSHIVAIHDRGLTAGHAYYVMDFVPGRTLDSFVSASDLQVADVLRLFIKICDAVNVAHLRGVIHRDLKPGNILVNEDGEPRILDFGLAKLEQEGENSSSTRGMTLTGQFIGSLPWASPEQAEGRADSLDVRTDVYSLGVILYHLLTSRFPYPVTGQLTDVIRHITQTAPERLSTHERRIDHDLELIVLKCLAKEPERRYQSAGELSRDIRRFLAHEPLEARPATAAYQLRRFIRRHRALTAAVASIFLILALATAGMTWALLQSTESNERATAINDFMRDILTSVDPATGSADVRLIEVMATASASAPQRFAGRPLQEAEVRDLLGEVYNNLTQWTDARNEMERALKLWTEHAGPDDPRTLATSLRRLGVIINLARFVEAEKIIQDLLPRMERVLGPRDPLTLEARHVLAITQMFRGKYDEAERLLMELRAEPAFAGADADLQQIKIIHTLTSLALRRMLDVNRQEALNMLKKIEPLARERVERATRRYGADSPTQLHARARLADIVRGLGRNQEAADLSRDILNRSADRLGDCHFIRKEASHVLSEALTALGGAREAANLRMHEVACTRRLVDPGDPVLLSMLSDSLRYLERAGDGATGEMIARELVEALRQVGGGHGDMFFAAESYLARFISMQGRHGEAETLFESLGERANGVQNNLIRARYHLFYGHHLVHAPQFELAEREMNVAAALTGDLRVGTWATHPDDITLGFIALCEARGNRPEIEKYRQLRDEAWAIAAGSMAIGEQHSH